jgi:hypothetical protein
MISFTEEEFEALAKKIFAVGRFVGIRIGEDSALAYERGYSYRVPTEEQTWEDEVQYLFLRDQMDISKIEDWDRV